MATTSAVYLQAPTDDDLDSGFYVHYDGDHVGAALRELIARDGYPAVFAMFDAQESRYWRELSPDAGDALPEHVTRFPQNIPVCRAVPGYGVLFVGDEELAVSREFCEVDLDTQGDRAYRVDRTGRVSTARWSSGRGLT